MEALRSLIGFAAHAAWLCSRAWGEMVRFPLPPSRRRNPCTAAAQPSFFRKGKETSFGNLLQWKQTLRVLEDLQQTNGSFRGYYPLAQAAGEPGRMLATDQ